MQNSLEGQTNQKYKYLSIEKSDKRKLSRISIRRLWKQKEKKEATESRKEVFGMNNPHKSTDELQDRLAEAHRQADALQILNIAPAPSKPVQAQCQDSLEKPHSL